MYKNYLKQCKFWWQNNALLANGKKGLSEIEFDWCTKLNCKFFLHFFILLDGLVLIKWHYCVYIILVTTIALRHFIIQNCTCAINICHFCRHFRDVFKSICKNNALFLLLFFLLSQIYSVFTFIFYLFSFKNLENRKILCNFDSFKVYRKIRSHMVHMRIKYL